MGNDGETPCACASAYADATLPFAEKAGDERPENDPLWQPKIVYPATLMETSPHSYPLKREA